MDSVENAEPSVVHQLNRINDRRNVLDNNDDDGENIRSVDGIVTV